MNLNRILLPVAALIAAAACSQGEPVSSTGPALTPALPSPAMASAHEKLLSWGQGPGQLGLRSGGPAPAAGPSAIAVGPDGTSFVLDGMRDQVVGIRPDGTLCSWAAPRDAEDIGIGDEALALFSPLRAKVQWLDLEGRSLGEVSVPRELRDIQSIAVAPSRSLLVRTAFQETFTIGSPQTSASLPAILQSKKEGAAFLPDGRGLAVRRTAARTVELLVLESDATGRSVVARHFEVAKDADAGRVVGASGYVACVRVERVSQSVSLHVARELACIDTRAGETTLRAGLPEPGLYVPRSEVAMGGSAPRVAWMHPRPEGLLVTVRAALEGRLP